MNNKTIRARFSDFPQGDAKRRWVYFALFLALALVHCSPTTTVDVARMVPSAGDWTAATRKTVVIGNVAGGGVRDTSSTGPYIGAADLREALIRTLRGARYRVHSDSSAPGDYRLAAQIMCDTQPMVGSDGVIFFSVRYMLFRSGDAVPLWDRTVSTRHYDSGWCLYGLSSEAERQKDAGRGLARENLRELLRALSDLQL